MRVPVLAVVLLMAAVAGCLGNSSDDIPEPGNGDYQVEPAPGNSTQSGNVTNTTTPPVAEPLDWGAVADQALRPGILVQTTADTCTAGFLMTDSWERYFFATAAHCVDTGGDELDGCEASTLPLGSAVNLQGLDGTEYAAKLAYSSWIAMQETDEQDSAACLGNDFALVEVAPADWVQLHPAVRHFGGPTSLRDGGSASGETVVAYGASPLRSEASQTNPRQGTSLGMVQAGWAHRVYLASPAVTGDSGGPLLDDAGAALGIASTLSTTGGAPASNTFTDVHKATEYMFDHTGLDAKLVTWDQFDPATS